LGPARAVLSAGVEVAECGPNDAPNVKSAARALLSEHPRKAAGLWPGEHRLVHGQERPAGPASSPRAMPPGSSHNV